ncbi:MAG: DUF5076 domain-containing protein [Pseudomonadota bacterium]
MFWKKKQSQSGQVEVQHPMLFVLREESAQQTLSVHLDAKQLGTPAEAGLMLADIARHMAHALAETEYDGTEAEAFTEIVTLFNAEAKAPTQAVTGGLAQ